MRFDDSLVHVAREAEVIGIHYELFPGVLQNVLPWTSFENTSHWPIGRIRTSRNGDWLLRP